MVVLKWLHSRSRWFLSKDALTRVDFGVDERAEHAERGGDEKRNVPAKVADQIRQQRR